MTVVLLWLGSALLAASVVWRTTGSVAVRAPLRRRNHRGLELANAGGITIIMGILAGLGLVAVVRALTGTTSDRLLGAAAWGLRGGVAVLGFGLLGLWDDLSEQGHGWRTHLGAVARGEVTGGAVKLAGGVALALVVVAPTESTLWWTIGDAALVAMSANAFNLFDAKPGRAGKVFLIAALPMAIVGGPTAPMLAAGIGGVVAFLPFDLRERAMLGDAGANAIGALIGVGIVAVGSDLARIVALGALLVLHVLAERPGLSVAIARVPPLRTFDQAGRVAP